MTQFYIYLTERNGDSIEITGTTFQEVLQNAREIAHPYCHTVTNVCAVEDGKLIPTTENQRLAIAEMVMKG